tara:strand:- start:18167 stop:18316 length:150 start_codon:yes stop_codon:yes gene_type:complete
MTSYPKLGVVGLVGRLPNFDLIKLTSNIKLLPALGNDYPKWAFLAHNGQ